ncbi:hypothetical protein ACFL08_00360 [Patescibacteria group bacterium]
MDWKIAHVCCICSELFACKFDTQTRYCCDECENEKVCTLKSFSNIQIDRYGLCLYCEIEAMIEREEIREAKKKLTLVR